MLRHSGVTQGIWLITIRSIIAVFIWVKTVQQEWEQEGIWEQYAVRVACAYMGSIVSGNLAGLYVL